MQQEAFDQPSDSERSVRERTHAAPSRAATILLVDDNPQVTMAIALAFDCAGHRVDTATHPEEALSMLAGACYDIILLDLNFRPGQTDGTEGFALLDRIMADDRRATVIVITAHSGIRLAVAAMRRGAVDFVMKPWKNADLVARVEAALDARHRTVSASSDRGRQPPPMSARPHRLLGDSPVVAAIRATVGKIAPSIASVLIAGPPGSGRSLTAALIHDRSKHAEMPPTSVDVRDPASRERIDGATGTLILRHPDELDVIQQDRLLERLPAGARLVAIVTDRERLSPRLRSALGTVEITMPTLRRRDGDALLLARHFARAAADRHARPMPIFTASAEAAILAADWPDEVRGLARAIERAVLLGEEGIIDGAALAEWTLPTIVEDQGAAHSAPLDINLRDSERLIVEAALRQHKHNISHAAAALGLSRQALYRRMIRYDL